MMKILPVTYASNTVKPQAFNKSGAAAFLNEASNIGKIISKNPKTLGLATAGIMLAGAMLYMASKFFGSKESSQTKQIKQILKKDPSKLKNIQILEKYPKILNKYTEFLINNAKDPNNAVAKNLLGLFEIFLEQNNKITETSIQEETLQSLEDNYSDDMENLCTGFFLHLKNNGSPRKFLKAIRRNRLSSDDFMFLSKYPNFNLNDLLNSKELSEEVIEFLNNQKKEGNIKGFITSKSPDLNYYYYALDFPEGKTLKENFQTIVKMHEAMHGPIALKKDHCQAVFTKEDLESELYDRLKKDKILDSVYNLVKFLKPKILENYNFTSEEVKLMPENSKRYRKLREDLGRGLVTINYDSPRAKQLLEIINDKSLPKDILANGHATLRFISRFVLKDNFNPNLEKDTNAKINEFKKDLEERFNKRVKVYKYRHKNGSAPYFYLGKTSLGDYIRITLNKNGEIHTLFEAIRKNGELEEKQA